MAVSYLPDKTYLPDWMKVSDIFKMFTDFYSNFDIEKARDMLGRLNISEGERLKALSKGNKEKDSAYTRYEQKCKIISS